MILSPVPQNVTVKITTVEKRGKHILNQMYSLVLLNPCFKYQEVFSLKSSMAVTSLRFGTQVQHTDLNWK